MFEPGCLFSVLYPNIVESGEEQVIENGFRELRTVAFCKDNEVEESEHFETCLGKQVELVGLQYNLDKPKIRNRLNMDIMDAMDVFIMNKYGGKEAWIS